MGKQSGERKARQWARTTDPNEAIRALIGKLRPYHRLLAMLAISTSSFPSYVAAGVDYFTDAHIFDVNGIEKYVEAHYPGHRMHLHDSLKRFGRIVAPYHKTVLEFRMPQSDMDWVVLVTCFKADEEYPGFKTVTWHDEGDADYTEMPGWVLCVDRFIHSIQDGKPHISATNLGLSIYLHSDGVCDGFDFYHKDTLAPVEDLTVYPGYALMQYAAACAAGTFALLNSPEVTTVEQEPNWKYNEVFKRVTGKSLTRYHVVTVKQERLQYVSDKTVSEFKDAMPLHDVRAHWRNSLDHPIPQFRRVLFIPSHQRGSEKNGIVVKDYKVKPEPTP